MVEHGEIAIPYRPPDSKMAERGTTRPDSTHSTYVKFTNTHPSSPENQSETSGQLTAIQATLAVIMSRMDEIQARQTVFEKELSALKKPEPPKQNMTITTHMSPTDVSAVV